MERVLNWKRPLVALILLAFIAGPMAASLTGCASVKAVTEWVVGFAKETGEFIVAKAKTFADALAAAWRAFWGTDKVNNVIVDKENPLHGKYDGILQCKAEWNRTEGSKEHHNELSIKLDRPRMIRKSPETVEWDFAPKNGHASMICKSS